MKAFTILCFGGVVAAAIQLRKRTEWHRRMMFCAMATLAGPAFGRLLPMPLMIPYAEWRMFAVVMIWPVSAIVGDARRRGRVHPALWWGSATIILVQVAMSLVAHSALGSTLYAAATSGSRGASVAPLAFPPAPAP